MCGRLAKNAGLLVGSCPFFGKSSPFSVAGGGSGDDGSPWRHKKLPPHRCGWGGSEVNVPADGVGTGISLGVRRVCARYGRE